MSVSTDMCVNSCIAFTGPWSDLDECFVCNQKRYDEKTLEDSNGKSKVPRRQFQSMLLSPQLQTLWRSPESAVSMRYRHDTVERRPFSYVLQTSDLLGG